MNWYMWLLLAVGLLWLVLELVGVARKEKNDTITETWRHLRDKLPKPVRLMATWLLAGFFVWALLHLSWDLV